MSPKGELKNHERSNLMHERNFESKSIETVSLNMAIPNELRFSTVLFCSMAKNIESNFDLINKFICGTLFFLRVCVHLCDLNLNLNLNFRT